MRNLREAGITRAPGNIRNAPELTEIPDGDFPGNVFLVLDGNSRWIEQIAQGALAGNPVHIEIVKTGVERLHGLFQEFVAETPMIDRPPYIGEVQDLAENFVRLPIKDTVDQLTDLKVLPLLGHLYGTDVLEMHLRSLRGLPIRYVGAWGLSAENLTRPGPEVDGLMWLFERELARHEQELQDADGRFVHLGDKNKLPERLQHRLRIMEDATADNGGQVFYLPLGFSGEDQEIRAMQRLNDNPKPTGTIFDATMRREYLDGRGSIPPADLIYLPGRSPSRLTHTSDLGYLQGKATQLYFVETLWPDTTTQILVDGIVAFAREPKRMGARPSSPLA